jgi:uncharacterized membrane protein
MDKLIDVASDLPFARHVSREVWEVKLILLLLVFVVAYFKFTWALRQFNMLSILIGAAPPPGRAPGRMPSASRVNPWPGTSSTGASGPITSGWRRCSGLSSRGLRGGDHLIVLVLYRRDFMSQTYAAMRRCHSSCSSFTDTELMQ